MATSKADNEQLKTSKLFDVSHVTAVVTGGNSGIGLMITRALVANGAKVYMVGMSQDGAEKTAEEHNTGPGKIIPYVSAEVQRCEVVVELSQTR